MRKIFYFLIFCFFSCRTVYDRINVCGEYNHLQIDKNNMKTVYTLVLCNDGTYSYYQDSLLIYNMFDCKSKNGTWEIKGESILLKSYFPECLIKKIKQEIESKDSIKIEILKMSDNTPKEGAMIFFKLKDLSYKETNSDSNGIIVYPRKNVKKIVIPTFGAITVQPPPKGYFYRTYYKDCYHWMFNKKKFIISNDTTLIERDVLKYYDSNKKKIKETIESKYIKRDIVR